MTKISRRSFALGTAAAVAVVASPNLARAQAWPARPLTILVPWGAGGGTDAHARTLGGMLERELGVAVNVANRTGGNGVTGHSAIAEAAPDGYTFGAVTAEITMMHQTGLTRLTHRDFTPVALLNRTEAGFIVRADSPWTNLAQALAAIRANPGRFRSSGTAQGGIWHIAMGGLLRAAGIDSAASPWIPSQGAARAFQELLAGGVDIVTASPGEGVSLLEARQAKALAVMSPQRNPRFPDVPTVREQGIDWELTSFISFQGPRGVPAAIVQRLDAAIRKSLESREWAEFAGGRGFTINYANAADLEALQVRLDRDMGDTMRALGLTRT